MKHLLLIACPVLLTSCGLANKLIQAPMRLIQSGTRTLTEAGPTTTPAAREAAQTYGIAVRTSELRETP